MKRVEKWKMAASEEEENPLEKVYMKENITRKAGDGSGHVRDERRH